MNILSLAFQITSTIGAIWLLWIFTRNYLYKKANYQRSLDFVFLDIRIPKKESKEDVERDRDQASDMQKVVSIGQKLIASLYSIYEDEGIFAATKGQDYLSLEYVAIKGEIHWMIGCPSELKELLKKQITSFYTDAVIEEISAPRVFESSTHQSVAYLDTTKSFEFPILTYTSFDTFDPINTPLNALANASDEHGNAAAIQFLIRPKKDGWQKKVRQKSSALKNGKSGSGFFDGIRNFFSIIISSPDEENKKETPTGDEVSQAITSAMESKSEQSGFETIIRCITSGPDRRETQVKLKSILGAFSQYSKPGFNGFTTSKWQSSKKIIESFIFRKFERENFQAKPIIMTPEELASLYHLPHTKYNRVPSIKWQKYKIVQSPNNIPKEGLLLGHNIYRGKETPIYMKREDRFRHFYVIGQTGTGKSTVLLNMIRQDLTNGDGFAVVDPHGQLVEDILPFIPKERIDDVIIFNPADLERPMGLNILEAETPEDQEMVALDAMNVMIKLFNEETFGPRIQDYFRNGCLTLMADPQGGCITDIVRLFTDDTFQQAKVRHVKNPIVKNFWSNQMAKTGAREKAEMIPYFSAKFGAFITNAMMRNILGQPKSAFDFSEAMDSNKILLMNLSKGATGDINSKLLGLIIVQKIQMAALRRQRQKKEDRVDFFLYIDEFQNYVTDSIESILSEARKYRLGLNLAHQYISQIEAKGKNTTNLKDAVFGNVGTMMCYKISAQDSEAMAKEMAPTFSDQDLINIDKFKAVMKLSIDTQPSTPFSIIPENPYGIPKNEKMAEAIKQISRLTYGRSRKFVEREIFTRLDI